MRQLSLGISSQQSVVRESEAIGRQSEVATGVHIASSWLDHQLCPGFHQPTSPAQQMALVAANIYLSTLWKVMWVCKLLLQASAYVHDSAY